MRSTKTACALLVLCIVAAAVTLPRFNRADWIVDAWTGDRALHHEVYVGPVQWIRGKLGLYGYPDVPGEQLLEAPFGYRLAVPALAAVLPFSPMTAINMLNVLFVVATVLLLYRLQRLLALPDRDALTGCALVAVSFPTFYYSTIGWIDPVVVFAIAACLNLIYERRHLAAALVIGVGFLAKENIIMVLPALAAGAWQTSRSWKVAALWTML
ncbi:MAG: glycosyltransferase family 39 protein, partial [Gammaproteobacteria bacterium]|nr:glycosyltransferase family 39 protein [Gammaproteobacteria bacterium]